MAKTHFGNDEIGIMCKSGMSTAPNTTIDWDEVDCKSCRTTKLQAGEVPAAACKEWLTSRIAANTKARARQAQWRQEMHDQEVERAATEQVVLDGLEHDFKTMCPDVFTRRKPVESVSWRRVTEELTVQSKTSLDMLLVTVRFEYHDSPHEGSTCDVTWKGLHIDVWRGNMQELTEVIPADRLIEYWKLGPEAAKQRAIAARDAALAEDEEVV